MHDEKSLQDFEQGGNNCLKHHLVVVWKTEHSGTRLETEFRQEATATVIWEMMAAMIEGAKRIRS